MYDFPGQIDHYKVTVRVKCFNDSCDNILEHTFHSDDNTPRIDGACPKCGKEYSRKVNNIDDRIVHKESTPVYR